jgi:hypothetical protein
MIPWAQNRRIDASQGRRQADGPDCGLPSGHPRDYKNPKRCPVAPPGQSSDIKYGYVYFLMENNRTPDATPWPCRTLVFDPEGL